MDEGPLSDIRVVELCSEMGAWAGRLLADFGAEVILVEPPGGHYTRTYAPFYGDVEHPDRSLWFWHYNANKYGVTMDLSDLGDRDRFFSFVKTADVLLYAEQPRFWEQLGIEHSTIRTRNARIISSSITAFGPQGARSQELATDLTLLASGGAAWSCGYDDHSLPPVRGGGNQGYQTACHFAVQAILVAVLEREVSGIGQHIDVNANAAINVTTESATTNWTVAGIELSRQTGRHAAPMPTLPTQYRCRDGLYVNTSLPGESGAALHRVVTWLDERGLLAEFPECELLAVATDAMELPVPDPLDQDGSLSWHRTLEMQLLRQALQFLATKSSAHQFFEEAQAHAFAVAPVNSPEAAFTDRHVRERQPGGQLFHDELGRRFQYPGPAINGMMSLRRRAPLLGEHNELLLPRLNASHGT